MKRNELRPVEYRSTSNINLGRETASNTLKPYNGWFHMWKKRVFEDKDEKTIAIIENEAGDIVQVDAIHLRFIEPYTNKEIYRPVEYSIQNPEYIKYLFDKSEDKIKNDRPEDYLHLKGWFQGYSVDGQQHKYAIVERENGQVDNVLPANMKFTDRVLEPQTFESN